MDLDQNKSLDARELELGLDSFGINLNKEQIQALISYFDKDGNRTIDFTEFRAALRVSKNEILILHRENLVQVVSILSRSPMISFALLGEV